MTKKTTSLCLFIYFIFHFSPLISFFFSMNQQSEIHELAFDLEIIDCRIKLIMGLYILQITDQNLSYRNCNFTITHKNLIPTNLARFSHNKKKKMQNHIRMRQKQGRGYFVFNFSYLIWRISIKKRFQRKPLSHQK